MVALALVSAPGCAQKVNTTALLQRFRETSDVAKAQLAEATRLTGQLRKAKAAAENKMLAEAVDATQAARDRLRKASQQFLAETPPSSEQAERFSAAMDDVDRAAEALGRTIANVKRKLPAPPKKGT
jgi:hypothetical protein